MDFVSTNGIHPTTEVVSFLPVRIVKRIGAPTSRIIDVDAFVKRVDNQTKVRKFRI